MVKKNLYIFCSLFVMSVCTVTGQEVKPFISRTIEVGFGWAGNSVNTVVFRKNALTSFGNMQVVSYYDVDGSIILGKRNLGDHSWTLYKTQYTGQVKDAHRSISIAFDGNGYLHMAWGHHGDKLNYCRSTRPNSLEMGPATIMIGKNEDYVTYPEFYRMPDGALLFFYRDGSSGNGNLVINKYDPLKREWSSLTANLIDGEKKRNAYWQAFVDSKGNIHISWVWRESPDVATNHDLCYAVSRDGGQTWLNSAGLPYILPVTQATAEIVCSVPQQSELINQTSMYADEKGRIFIATYWKGVGGVPQYKLVSFVRRKWEVQDLGICSRLFSLSGQGTKSIPLSRPQVVSWSKGKNIYVSIIFRDEDRGSAVSIATKNLRSRTPWNVTDLPSGNTGSWEPLLDIDLWKKKNQLHLFVQTVVQKDAEGVLQSSPTVVKVLECSLTRNK